MNHTSQLCPLFVPKTERGLWDWFFRSESWVMQFGRPRNGRPTWPLPFCRQVTSVTC